METFYITIIIVLPIVLSSRYFSKKYTRDVAIISFFIFFATTALGVYFGMYSNVNNLYFPKHTVLYLGDQSYIMDAMGAGYIKFDHLNMLYHELVDTYSGEVIQGLIIAIISYLIASHGRKMVFQQKDLTENTARVGAELNLATKIQADMLPSVFPAFPRREEFDLFASMTPAKEVGGDFYDFFMIDDDHLGLVIADVSGKGIPAAMFMMFTKNIIANNAMRGMPPAEALRNANDQVCANNTEDMFVTVWLGVLTISTGNMICSSAGHEYPVLKHGDGGYELLKDPHGLAVGFIDGSEYTEYEIQFDPGDKLFVYTDGVPEATDANKEMFGTDRIVETLNKDVDASCEQMLKNIWDAVDDFVGEAEQFDDLTMLSVEYRGL